MKIKYQLKNPYAKVALGFSLTALFVLLVASTKTMMSALIAMFVVGTFLMLVGIVEIFAGKDILTEKMNKLKTVELCMYIALYMATLSAILWLLDYFFPTGWQLLLQIMVLLCLATALICFLIKKIRKI